MDDSEDDANSPTTTDLDLKTRKKILDNETRSFKNRGFHDGYTDGKNAVIQESFDTGYQKAFEQNFILSTLKGVAHALQSSYNLKNPTSAISSPSPTSSPSQLIRMRDGDRRNISNLFGSGTATTGDISSSSCSSSSEVSATTIGNSNINVNNISSNHLSILESMKFDNAGEIESIKEDLIKICRENRLEILAHYVSQIG